MDILLTDQWLPQLLFRSEMLVESEPLNDFLGENGFRSALAIKNLGSTFVFLIIYGCIWVLIKLLEQLGRFSKR